MMCSATDLLDRDTPCVLVEIEQIFGSSPREPGAWLLADQHDFAGTVGGGQLEYAALDHARRMLRTKARLETLGVALGPEIGQCCGGRVVLRFTRIHTSERAVLRANLAAESDTYPQVLIFGAGHVGRALATTLVLLPVCVVLVDSRVDELEIGPKGIEKQLTPLPEGIVKNAPPASAFVVLTHDHALDFLIADAALARRDASYVGLIGSKTKRAQFANWRTAQGIPREQALSGLTCPIGGPSGDKRPQVIAAHVASEIMRSFEPSDIGRSPTNRKHKVVCDEQ